MDFKKLQFLKYVYTRNVSKKRRSKVSKSVQLASVPQVVIQPNTKDFLVFQADIPNPSSSNLYLDELQSVRALACTRLLPKRLVLKYNDGVTRIWPLNRILEEDYKVLVKIYIKF